MEQTPVLDIDQNDLVAEWLRQVKLYMEWSMELAERKLRHAEAKSMLELVEAELDREVRAEPSLFGIEGRVTEGSISNCVKTRKRYQEAVGTVNTSKYQMDLAQAMVDTLEHRKKGMESITTLWVHNYWAEPKLPTADREELASRQMDRVYGKRKESGK